MQWYTVERIGRTRSLTPEGYLLVEGSGIARTGTLYYAPGEVPINPGTDGFIRIQRTDDEVFSPRSIASFHGKPLVCDHPPEDVGPENWRQHSCGVVLNPRRGEGVNQDLLVADLLFTEKAAIDRVNAGTVELSAGYTADYTDLGDGRGTQSNILANHVALVDRGRCGALCSVGDRMGVDTMATVSALAGQDLPKMSLRDRFLGAFWRRDEEALKAALFDVQSATHDAAAAPARDQREDEDEDDDRKKKKEDTEDKFGNLARIVKDIGDKVAALDQRMAKAEDSMKSFDQAMRGGKEETKDDQLSPPEGTEIEQEVISGDPPEAVGKGGYDKAPSRDSGQHLYAEFQDTLARAEMLSPGMRLPTYDAKIGTKNIINTICEVRRRALDSALRAEGGIRSAVEALLGGQDPAKLTCDALRPVFVGASEIAKRENNASVSGFFDPGHRPIAERNLSAINAANRAFWQNRGGIPK